MKMVLMVEMVELPEVEVVVAETEITAQLVEHQVRVVTVEEEKLGYILGKKNIIWQQ
jgi:hypothetical protein